MKTSGEIEKIANEIEEVLLKNRVATPNQYTISRLTFLANQLTSISRDAKAIARDITRNAELFYSLMKHESYKYGASGLYSEMLSLVSRIRRIARIFKARDD